MWALCCSVRHLTSDDAPEGSSASADPGSMSDADNVDAWRSGANDFDSWGSLTVEGFLFAIYLFVCFL